MSCVISNETSRYDRLTAVSAVYGSHNSSVAISCTVVLQHVSAEMERGRHQAYKVLKETVIYCTVVLAWALPCHTINYVHNSCVLESYGEDVKQ